MTRPDDTVEIPEIEAESCEQKQTQNDGDRLFQHGTGHGRSRDGEIQGTGEERQDFRFESRLAHGT